MANEKDCVLERSWEHIYGGAGWLLPTHSCWTTRARGVSPHGGPFAIVERVGFPGLLLVEGEDYEKLASWVRGWHEDGRCEHHSYGFYRCQGRRVTGDCTGLCPFCQARGIREPARRHT